MPLVPCGQLQELDRPWRVQRVPSPLPRRRRQQHLLVPRRGGCVRCGGRLLPAGQRELRGKLLGACSNLFLHLCGRFPTLPPSGRHRGGAGLVRCNHGPNRGWTLRFPTPILLGPKCVIQLSRLWARGPAFTSLLAPVGVLGFPFLGALEF